MLSEDEKFCMDTARQLDATLLAAENVSLDSTSLAKVPPVTSGVPVCSSHRPKLYVPFTVPERRTFT